MFVRYSKLRNKTVLLRQPFLSLIIIDVIRLYFFVGSEISENSSKLIIGKQNTTIISILYYPIKYGKYLFVEED